MPAYDKPIAARAHREISVVALLSALLATIVLACYRPRLVDCVLACSETQICPDGMTCSVGLCTRKTTACVLEVAAGSRHSCAIVGGQVQCWGNNQYGQLGIDSTQARGADDTPLLAVDLGGRAAIAIAAGGRHSCAVASDDSQTAPIAICWGDNTFGQLGFADGRARGALAGDTLAAVPLGAGRAVAELSAGLLHTCARLQDSSVVCWGDNRFGQLGVDGVNATFTPVDLGEPATAVSAGAYHSCAVLASGAVRCWGWNDYWQLGNRASIPAGSGASSNIVTPSVPAASAIATGAFHTCAVLQTGGVSCWGQDYAGQLGLLTGPDLLYQVPGNSLDLGRGRTARAIAAGASHTCALLDDFAVKCWGYNADGELGIGGTVNQGDNESLGDDLPPVALGSDPVSRLAVGANHACAIQTSGVKCWGLNESGRLGVGDLQNRGDDPSRPIAFVHLGRTNR